MEKKSRRKFFLSILGGIGTLILSAWLFRKSIIRKVIFNGNFNAENLSPAPSESDDLCVLTTSQVEGPFFFPSPKRKDIREDRNGQKLELKFQILKHPDCLPIKGAVVEIWHCDAEGTYSGYPEEISHDIWKTAVFVGKNGVEENGQMHVDPINDNRFLRGQQVSNDEGWVEFDTIFPGWYDGRVPHIHAKIITDKDEQLLTQFYFDPDLCDEIYTKHAPYDTYGKCPMKFEKDIVLDTSGEANGLMLNIKAQNSMNHPLRATAKIGLKTV